MKFLAPAIVAVLAASPVLAEGDVDAGKKGFNKCKACHTITAPDGEVILKGGRTGPNLYGVIGRVVGSEDFKYGAGLKEANAAGAVWSEETLAAYVVNPKAWLADNGYANKSKMTFKLKKGGADVAAYLASVAPAPTN